jgi:hypothetical protein
MLFVEQGTNLAEQGMISKRQFLAHLTALGFGAIFA